MSNNIARKILKQIFEQDLTNDFGTLKREQLI